MFDVIANFDLPKPLAAHVQRGGVEAAGVGEVDEDVLAVAGWRARGHCRFGVLFHPTVCVNGRLPEPFAAGAVIGKDRLGAGRFVGGGEEDAVADDDRRAEAAAGDGRLPKDVFVIAEFERRFLVRVRGPHPVRAAPPTPIGRGVVKIVFDVGGESRSDAVLGGERWCGEEDAGERDREQRWAEGGRHRGMVGLVGHGMGSGR